MTGGGSSRSITTWRLNSYEEAGFRQKCKRLIHMCSCWDQLISSTPLHPATPGLMGQISKGTKQDGGVGPCDAGGVCWGLWASSSQACCLSELLLCVLPAARWGCVPRPCECCVFSINRLPYKHCWLCQQMVIQGLKQKIPEALQCVFMRCDLFSNCVFWLSARYVQQSSSMGLLYITRAMSWKAQHQGISHESPGFWESKKLNPSLFIFLHLIMPQVISTAILP